MRPRHLPNVIYRDAFWAEPRQERWRTPASTLCGFVSTDLATSTTAPTCGACINIAQTRPQLINIANGGKDAHWATSKEVEARRG